MLLLSDDQLEQVDTKILESGITDTSLYDDLLDHIACEIEEKMAAGDIFMDAMNSTFISFNKKRIKEIEHTTRILTTDIMKRHTKIFGFVGFLLTLTGTGMKLLHLPGAASILGIGVLVLGFGFFSSNAIDTVRNLGTRKGKMVQILGAIGAMLTLIGALLKILHLPGAGILIGVGPFLLLLYFSFSSFLKTKMVD